MTSVTTEAVAFTLLSASWKSFRNFSTEAELDHIVSGLLTRHLFLHSSKYLSEGKTSDIMRTDTSHVAVKLLVKPVLFLSQTCKEQGVKHAHSLSFIFNNT